MHPDIIYSLVYIKKAAAITNCEVGLLDSEKAAANVAKKALKLDKSVFEIVTGEGILDAERAKEILDPKKMI